MIFQANSDVEWKVSRTQLRMSYFTDVGSLPPPFNLLPFQYPVKLCKMLTKHVCGIRCGDVSCLDNGRWKSRIDRHMDNYNVSGKTYAYLCLPSGHRGEDILLYLCTLSVVCESLSVSVPFIPVQLFLSYRCSNTRH